VVGRERPQDALGQAELSRRFVIPPPEGVVSVRRSPRQEKGGCPVQDEPANARHQADGAVKERVVGEYPHDPVHRWVRDELPQGPIVRPEGNKKETRPETEHDRRDFELGPPPSCLEFITHERCP